MYLWTDQNQIHKWSFILGG